MCAIVGSFDKEKLKELVRINSYRGSFSHSFATYLPNEKDLILHSMEFGPLDPNIIDKNFIEGSYGIAHIQAPTSAKHTVERIHPAIYSGSCLWHNGILKTTYINKHVKDNPDTSDWDTEIILRELVSNGYKILSTVDGSFSCLAFDGSEMFLFRNLLSPMFMDDDLSLSSTQFRLSYETPANSFFRINFETKKLELIGVFKTHTLPYFFDDEV